MRGVFAVDLAFSVANARPHYSNANGGHLYYDAEVVPDSVKKALEENKNIYIPASQEEIFIVEKNNLTVIDPSDRREITSLRSPLSESNYFF